MTAWVVLTHEAINVAAGREDPTALEASPVPEAERERVVRAIAEQDPKAGIAYWEAWLEDA